MSWRAGSFVVKNFTEATITITKDDSVPVCSTLGKLELNTLSVDLNGMYRGSFQNVKLTMDGAVTGRSAPIWETNRCNFSVTHISYMSVWIATAGGGITSYFGT